MPSTRCTFLGATAVALSLAGCTARSASVTRRESPDEFSSDMLTPLVESGATSFAVVTVGRERSGDSQSRQLWVWSDGSTRTIALELTRRSNSLVSDSKESLFTDETWYDADTIFVIELRKPATYVLDIAVGGRRKTSVRVPRSQFDCNHATTAFAVRSDATVKTETIATTMGCLNGIF